MMKRLLDLSVALVALIVLSPLLAIVAILIKLESPGPALFRQDRVGFGGKIFSICKFRSMYVSNDPNAPYTTGRADPRVTRVGHFIRVTSIDELPQLINVLTGDMSIVGPRPDLEIQKKDYDLGDWDLRISVRPGITGLAQVNGRSNLNFEDRLNYDLVYAKTHDFLLDVKIIAQTIAVVFSGKFTN